MAVLSSYIKSDLEDISCLIAQFLHMFITESPYLESHEIDNFILRNGLMLSSWCVSAKSLFSSPSNEYSAWRLYGIQRDEVSELRASFFVRTIVVDDQPFRAILDRCFRPGNDWQRS